ncbi:MAG: hypothetical protein P1U40_11325 [Coxiellaceae bacterium]|nr:hypothetical protein [Coxiellaceae bacterium]
MAYPLYAPNGAKISWITENGKHKTLVIEKNGKKYQFHTCKKRGVAKFAAIGFINTHTFRLMIDAPPEGEINISTYPKKRSPLISRRWVDQQILTLCGAEYLKGLTNSQKAQLLNDPTHSLSETKSNKILTVTQLKKKNGKAVTLTIKYKESTGRWGINEIRRGPYRFNATVSFKTRGGAIFQARKIQAKLAEPGISNEAIATWWQQQFGKGKAPLTFNGAAIYLNVRLFGEDISERFSQDELDACETETDVAIKLFEVRGRQYIGVETATLPDGAIRYRGHVPLEKGMHWYTRECKTPLEAAMLYDIARRQLNPLTKNGISVRFNHYNFFSGEFTKYHKITGTERAEAIKKGVSKYYVVKKTYGHIAFSPSHRHFVCKIRNKAGDLVATGTFNNETDAATAFDQALTQLHKDKASKMRIRKHDAKTIAQWNSEDFGASPSARVKIGELTDGINELYEAGKLVGYRAYFYADGHQYYSDILKFETDDEAGHKACYTKAQQAYDTLLARYYKRLNPQYDGTTALPATLKLQLPHNQKWWKSIDKLKTIKKYSLFHGVSKYGKSLPTKWQYIIDKTDSKGNHLELIIKPFSSQQAAAAARDRKVRELFEDHHITLEYYTNGINTPNAYEIALAHWILKSKAIGHNADGSRIDLTSYDHTGSNIYYDAGEVTGVVEYRKDKTSTDKSYIGIYAKYATKPYATIAEANAAAHALKNRFSVTLTAKDLHNVDLIGDLLAYDKSAPLRSDHSLIRSTINMRLSRGFGLRGVDNAGQGDCLFHAFADQLQLLGVTQTDGTAHTHESLRQLAVQEMLEHLDHYQPFIVGDAADFVWNMAAQGVWGDHLPIQALSRRLNLDVVITHRNAGADEPHGARTTVMRAHNDADLNPARTVMLGYIDATHYVSAHPLAATHPNHLDEATRHQRIRNRLEATEIDPGYAGDVAAINPAAQVGVAAPAAVDLDDDEDRPTATKRTRSLTPDDRDKDNSDSENDDDSILSSASSAPQTRPAKSRRRRVISDSDSENDDDMPPRNRAAMHGLFNQHRAPTYRATFNIRIDTSDRDQVFGRLAGLMNYLLDNAADAPFRAACGNRAINNAYVLNDVALSIARHQSTIGVSNRATAAIIRGITTLARTQPGYAKVNISIESQHTRAEEIITKSRIRTFMPPPPKTYDELVQQIKSVLIDTAHFGDNKNVNTSLLVNTIYAAINKQMKATPVASAALLAEFQASFGAENIMADATPETLELDAPVSPVPTALRR